jgi:hypothetical protein
MHDMDPMTRLTSTTAQRAARLNARRYPRKHHAPAYGLAYTQDDTLLCNRCHAPITTPHWQPVNGYMIAVCADCAALARTRKDA